MDWLMRLLFIYLAISKMSNAEFFILSGPEYKTTSWYNVFENQKTRDMFCVSDELSSSIVWNSNLAWKGSRSDRNQIFPARVLNNDRYVYSESDDVTCQMNHTTPCSQHWSRDGQWSYVNTEEKPMSPVTDNRWEEFPEIEIWQTFQNIGAIPSVGSQAISIRGSSNAHFAICNNQSTTDGVCFLIIIGGWKNTRTIITKCQGDIPWNIHSKPMGKCVTPLDAINATSLSSIEWKHFVIKWDFRTTIRLTLYDSNRKLVTYTEPSQHNYFSSHVKIRGDPTYFLFASSPNPMLMKLHKYSYLLTTSTRSKLISPKITITGPDRNICIEMSISLCENCQLTLDFIDSNNKIHVGGTFENGMGSNVYGLPTWKNIRFNETLKENLQLPFSLSINTLLTENEKQKFWAISNVRRCYSGRMKVVQIKAFQDVEGNWPSLTCQKLSAYGTSSIIDRANRTVSTINPETRPVCDNGKIGNSCSVSCSSLFQDNDTCQKLLICDKSGCSCAQGFTMPYCDEEPPAVHDLEIIEVDSKNRTITLRWKPLKPPLNGILDFYTITYCKSYSAKCDSNASIVLPTDLCKLWPRISWDMICATVPLPDATYNGIQITAYNVGEVKGSKLASVPVKRTELVPSKPSELRVVNINTVPYITAELIWAHPLISGDRLEEFQITVKLHNSSLKVKPWKSKNYSLKIGSDSYQPYYSTKIELFPASTFLISVNALTWLKKPGDKNETTFTLSPYTYFDNDDLMPQANESSFISIRIPKIVNDVEGSRLIVTVQGPRYCDEAVNTSENVYPYLNIESSSNKLAWMAVSLTQPESYVGKEFKVGNGETYGNAKNYILCPNEPYVIYLFLVDDLKDPADDKRILDSIKTSPIYIGEPPINYAMWLMFLFFVVLVLLIIIAYRKK